MRWALLLVVVFWIAADARPASAIPPFARRYGLSCSTCHVGGPTKLSNFGEAFRDNGYRIPGETESYLRDLPMQLGHPDRKALFPNTVWPGELPGSLPLGVSALISGRVNLPNTGDGAKSTAQLVATASILLGGSLGQHISVFGDMSASTTGVQLNQAFLVGRSLFEGKLGEAALNVKIGRMGLDLFPIQPGLQRSVLLPLSYEMAVGRDGFALGLPEEAIEIYGLLKGRLKWVIGAANGRKPLDDLTSRRDFFGRLQLKLGGTRLDYREASAGIEATSFSLGAATYTGVGVTIPVLPEPRFSSDIYRLLFDARLRTHSLDIIASAVLGQDSDPDGLGEQIRHLSWFLHMDYPILPWLQALVRYEEAYFDNNRHPNHRRLVLGAQAFIRANVRLRAEGAVGLTAADPHQFIGDLFFAL